MVKKIKRSNKPRSKVPHAAKDPSKTASQPTSLASLPDNLLERIALQLKSDGKLGSLAALDRTSKRVSAVCKSILWHDVTLKNGSFAPILFSKKAAYLRSLIRYLYIDTRNSIWFWDEMRKSCRANSTRNETVHAALPNVKMLVEHCTVPSENQFYGPAQNAPNIHIWISAQNHTRASTTMAKATQAILSFSGIRHESLEEYAAGITFFPVFAIRHDPDGFGTDQQVYLKWCHQTSGTVMARVMMAPTQAEARFNAMFEAYKAGTLASTFSQTVATNFKSIMKGLVEHVERETCTLNFEGLGTIPIHLLLEDQSAQSQQRAIVVAYELFLQFAGLFSTESNLESFGPMMATVDCWKLSRAEDWIHALLNAHDKDRSLQGQTPPTGLIVSLKEGWPAKDLFPVVWQRIQKSFLAHLARLPAMSTTDLPQTLLIRAQFDERINGIPIVDMDFTTAKSRDCTIVGHLDSRGGMMSCRVYRNGELVNLARGRGN